MTVSGAARRLPFDLELAAFRIVQEALNNVIQHARASQAWVEARFEVEYLGLSLGDNGQGFKAPDQPDALALRDHFELMGIQRRGLLHGGQMSIHSAPGDGVEIAVQMPYAFPH